MSEEFRGYPKAASIRSGCKVGWYTYATREEAEEAAAAARWNAGIKARYGYDFGYCSPGEIRETAAGEFVVTIP